MMVFRIDIFQKWKLIVCFPISLFFFGTIRRLQTVAAECLSRTSNCVCAFTSGGKEGRVSYTVQVDCSYTQMTSLPAQLPNFTSELDVSGNNVRRKKKLNLSTKFFRFVFTLKIIIWPFHKAVDESGSGDSISRPTAQNSDRRFQ
jgi:hypothetical protein